MFWISSPLQVTGLCADMWLGYKCMQWRFSESSFIGRQNRIRVSPFILTEKFDETAISDTAFPNH